MLKVLSMFYYYGIHKSKGKRKASSEDLWCNEVIDLSSPIHADKSHVTPTSAPVAKFSKCLKYYRKRYSYDTCNIIIHK